MNYQDRLKSIEEKINQTSDKHKLKEFMDTIKVSDLEVKDKGRLIDEIEIKITGRKFTDKEILKDIEESAADISDIN